MTPTADRRLLPPPPPPGSPHLYWTYQILGWLGYGAIQLYVGTVELGLDPVTMLLEVVALYGSALVLSHLLRRHIHTHRWDAYGALALTPRIVVASLVLGAPFGLLHSFTTLAALQDPDSAANAGIVLPAISLPARLALGVANWSALFAFWMIIYFLVVNARRNRFAKLQQSELARALQAAELRLLKSQLNPHFLFNSLNSVRALIASQPKDAQDAVTRLARILRYTLGAGTEQELVTLEQELEIVDDYLGLEGLRLGDRLRVERDVSDAALRARIPVMLLQTVVENGIKHGVAELPEGGVLRIAAQLRGGALLLQVDNPRPARAAPATHEGIGLRNATERLRLLFGTEATLDLALADGHATTRIRIPVQS